MNTPYVKEYKDGLLINPIKGKYANRFPNRRARRNHLNEDRFLNNSKNNPIVIMGKLKYKKLRQKITFLNKKTEEFESKVIEHYLPYNGAAIKLQKESK